MPWYNCSNVWSSNNHSSMELVEEWILFLNFECHWYKRLSETEVPCLVSPLQIYYPKTALPILVHHNYTHPDIERFMIHGKGSIIDVIWQDGQHIVHSDHYGRSSHWSLCVITDVCRRDHIRVTTHFLLTAGYSRSIDLKVDRPI